MKPKLLAIALLFGMMTTAVAHADTVAMGPYTSSGYSLAGDIDEARDAAHVAVAVKVADIQNSLGPGWYVVGVTYSGWSWDGLEFTLTYHIWVSDEGGGY